MVDFGLHDQLSDLFEDQLIGESTKFVPIWLTSVILTEYSACCAIIACIYIRNIYKTHLLELLHICELDERAEALRLQADILVPLQQEISKNKFNEELLDDNSTLMTQKNADGFAAGDFSSFDYSTQGSIAHHLSHHKNFNYDNESHERFV